MSACIGKENTVMKCQWNSDESLDQREGEKEYIYVQLISDMDSDMSIMHLPNVYVVIIISDTCSFSKK